MLIRNNNAAAILENNFSSVMAFALRNSRPPPNHNVTSQQVVRVKTKESPRLAPGAQVKLRNNAALLCLHRSFGFRLCLVNGADNRHCANSRLGLDN